MKEFMYECKTEEERQQLRDHYLEVLYHQNIRQTASLTNMQERLKKLEEKIDLISRRQIEAQFLKEIVQNGRTEV